MCNFRVFPWASRRFQSNRRNVASLVCCTSANSTPPPTAWTVPAGRNTQSPGRGWKLCRQSATVPACTAAPDHGTKEGNELQRRKHGAASRSSSLARRPADGLRVSADHLVHGAVHAHRAMVHPDATGAELPETDEIMTDHDDKPGPIHH